LHAGAEIEQGRREGALQLQHSVAFAKLPTSSGELRNDRQVAGPLSALMPHSELTALDHESEVTGNFR